MGNEDTLTLERHAAAFGDMTAHTSTLTDYATECQTIVELGVRSGVSTWALLDGLPEDGDLISVDIVQPDVPARVSADHRWRILVGDSVSPEVRDRLPETADLVFIDTSHEYAQTVKELALAASLKPKRIVLHDGDMWTVAKAIREFEGWYVETYTDPHGLVTLKPGEPDASVPVLVLAYQDPEALTRCIVSVDRQSVWSDALVHDNSETNIGYSAGVNALLRQVLVTPAPYAILLNQDAQLAPDAVRKAVDFMDAHPKCAIGGFKQLDPSDPDIINHGGTGPILPGVHLTGRVSAGDHAVSKRFLWVNGAAWILRMDAVFQIGVLDERFFLCGSDSDYCLRARLKRWEVWYIADAVCLHGREGCSNKPTKEQSPIITADMNKWAEKWSAVVKGANNRA